MSGWAVVTLMAGMCSIAVTTGLTTLLAGSPPAMVATVTASAVGAWRLTDRNDR